MVLLAGETVPSPTRPKEDAMTNIDSHILVAEAPTWKTLPLIFADGQDADISITSWMFNDPQCDLATYLATEEEVDEVDEATARNIINTLTRAAAGAPLNKEDHALLEASNIACEGQQDHSDLIYMIGGTTRVDILPD